MIKNKKLYTYFFVGIVFSLAMTLKTETTYAYSGWFCDCTDADRPICNTLMTPFTCGGPFTGSNGYDDCLANCY